MPQLTKKFIFIFISTAALLAIAATLWILNVPDEQPSDNGTGPSEQSDIQTTQPDNTIPEEELEQQNSQPADETNNVPQETPPQEVDDRGGYTPY